jgi:hypothetical protein
MCSSLSQWLGSNGADLVCLQLQGLSGSGEGSTTSTIISGLYDAASAAAAHGGHLQLQQLCLDGDSLLDAMRLLPLMPHLQQVELTSVDLAVGPGDSVSSSPTQAACLQQLQNHAGITRLTLNFNATMEFDGTWDYGSKVVSLLLRTACPQQLQHLTLRWEPPSTSFGHQVPCSIHFRQLAHLKQLRQLTLDTVTLSRPCVEDAEVTEEVVGRLEQVKLLFQDEGGDYKSGLVQHLDAEALPALLPKLVEFHASRPTIVEVAAAATNLTSIRWGMASSSILPRAADIGEVLRALRGLQQLRKLVLPHIPITGPTEGVDLLSYTTCLKQLQELSITQDPLFLELEHLTSLPRLTSLSLHMTRATPSSIRGYLWQSGGLHLLTGLQHLGVQAFFLAAASPAVLETFTALTSLTISFGSDIIASADSRPWQEQLAAAAADLSKALGLQQRLRVVYAVSVVSGGVRKVYRALRRALPRTRVEVCVGDSVPGWLREAA